MSLQIFQVNLKMQNKIFICLLYKSKDNHDVTTKQLNYMIVRIVDNNAIEMQKLVKESTTHYNGFKIKVI